MYALYEKDLKDSINKYPTIKFRKYMLDVIYKNLLIDRNANEIKNSQPNNLKEISPWQDLLMKDEPIVSNYIVDSYQKLFEEIKKEVKSPISFAQYKNQFVFYLDRILTRALIIY